MQLIERWTKDLAPVEVLQSSLYHLHAKASKAGKGSAAHRELIAARHAIASAWRAFQRHAVWPSPAVEFRILLDHLRQPAPTPCLTNPKPTTNRNASPYACAP